METTSYRAWEKRQRRQGAGRRSGAKQRGGKVALGAREKRRLIQLVVCLVLFLSIFLGKGLFPARMETLRATVRQAMGVDTDFKAVFADLGRAISAGEPVLDTLGGFWVDVFGGETVTVYAPERGEYPGARAQASFLSGYPTRVNPAEHWLGTPVSQPVPSSPPEEQPAPTPQPTPAPAAVETMAYDGPTLPTNATMDKYNLTVLGVAETATPALGWVASDFGWREHPVDGGEKFHNGVDLAVNDGTAVGAFAGGVVDYIGDNPEVYGKYLKIDHGGGLSTFYAHCSQLLVQQGQQVTAGQAVALSGQSGNATGPHLHFEIKLNETLLNPLYYIETS